MGNCRRVLVLGIVSAAFVVITISPATASDVNSITFPSFLSSDTNPCDGSTVPERTGTTTLRVTEFTKPSGRTVVLVNSDLTVSAGEYVTVILTRARFDAAADAYVFSGDALTYRNGALEFIVSGHTETVFMSGDQPIGHLVGGGTHVCARSGG
jgi:hypothetical protein